MQFSDMYAKPTELHICKFALIRNFILFFIFMLLRLNTKYLTVSMYKYKKHTFFIKNNCLKTSQRT